SAYTRTISKEQSGDHWLFEAKDSLASYTAKYSIDLKAGALNADSWVKCGGAALQVQKMAIPCWSQFDSLNAVLQSRVNLKAVQAKLESQSLQAKVKTP